MTAKRRVLLVSIVPPRNDCGVRIVMYRHFIDRSPFELHVASNADFAEGLVIHTQLRLPYLVHRLRKSRFGPRLAAWITDYENFIWPLTANDALEEAVEHFQPRSDTYSGGMWIMSHRSKNGGTTQAAAGRTLSRLVSSHERSLRSQVDAADSEPTLSRALRRVRFGVLHQRWHAGDARAASQQSRDLPHAWQTCCAGKGLAAIATENSVWFMSASVENFYGRMLCSLIEKIEATSDLEIIVVGPNADWPKQLLERARANGTYLGFKPPEEAAEVLASADALLSVMSFEKEHELFMRTSFTTKFLDYVSFGKPVILWGPEYCTPVRVAREHGGAAVVSAADADSSGLPLP